MYLWWDAQALGRVTNGTQCGAWRTRGVRVDTRDSHWASGVLQDVNRGSKRQSRHVDFLERNIFRDTKVESVGVARLV